MNVSWVIGERVVGPLKGKNGGLSVKQDVCKVYTPRSIG